MRGFGGGEVMTDELHKINDKTYENKMTEIETLKARVAELESHINQLTTWEGQHNLKIRAWDVMKEQEMEIKELRAQLEAIGAGGVSGQRITKKGEDK